MAYSAGYADESRIACSTVLPPDTAAATRRSASAASVVSPIGNG